jgi:uncharacterized protein
VQQRETQLERRESKMELFVFPLKGVVFYPTLTLPLNIFEPRYIQMVRDSLKEERPIALSPADPMKSLPLPGKTLRRKKGGLITGFGTPLVLKERPDGSMVILLKGLGKAKLNEVVREKPYLVCRASEVNENNEIEEKNRFVLNRLKKMLVTWIDENISETDQAATFVSNLNSPQKILECLSMCLVSDAEVQQSILEKDDVNDRVRFIQELFLKKA